MGMAKGDSSLLIHRSLLDQVPEDGSDSNKRRWWLQISATLIAVVGVVALVCWPVFFSTSELTLGARLRELWPSPAFFEKVANISCSVFFLSPLVQMVEVYQTKGKVLSIVMPQTFILMFFNCSLWVAYGLYAPLWATVPGNLLGLLSAVFCLCFCFGHIAIGRGKTEKWGRTAAGATVAAVVLTLALAAYARSSPERAQQVGNLAMVICVCLFASPLSELGQVIRDKSSEVLPPAWCGMQFVNCALWLVVGVNTGAVPVLVCNSLGFMLAGFQLALIAILPSTPAAAAAPAGLVKAESGLVKTGSGLVRTGSRNSLVAQSLTKVGSTPRMLKSSSQPFLGWTGITPVGSLAELAALVQEEDEAEEGPYFRMA